MNLILGDDQAIFLDALSTVLTQHGYDVGAVARSPEEMIAHVRHQRPDACLIDCNLAVDGGIKTIQNILEASESTTVVVLSADPDAESAERAVDAGASGYLHQSRGVEVLVSALDRILNGECVVDVPSPKPGQRPPKISHANNLAASLTGRERECLSLLVAGLDTEAMVKRLGVSRTTVRTHLQGVLTKLCVHSRLEAASFAVRHRLIDGWAESADAAAAQASGTGAAAANGNGVALPRQRTAASRQPAEHRWPATIQELPASALSAPGRGPEPSWQEPAELAASG
jgi:two-component system nitrate/nitrite response regulator NarL